MATVSAMSQSRRRFTVGDIKKALLLWHVVGFIAALKRGYGTKVTTSYLSDWKAQRAVCLACPCDDLKLSASQSIL